MDAQALSGDETMSFTDNSSKDQPNCRHGGHKGPSSFWMHDPQIVFGEINLKPGETFLDLGCGLGDYSIYAAKIVGASGMVYAVDKQEELVNNLIEKATTMGLKNILAIKSDITSPLSLKDHTIDVCFVSTVLHCIDTLDAEKVTSLFIEIRRVLKPTGRLIIIECKKEDMTFGPPKNMRLSPDQIKSLITPHGFGSTGFVDLGYNYMIQYTLQKTDVVI
ncbi:MAG: class I SAM-dependent methyltransferase [Candidatus Bathyarchaeia archaeon]